MASSSAPVKGNGTLYNVTDADDYDSRTSGWFKKHFPETYRIQKSMPPGRDHEQFRAFKTMALALGKVLRESHLNENTTKPQSTETSRLSPAERLKKAIESRRAKWAFDEAGAL